MYYVMTAEPCQWPWHECHTSMDEWIHWTRSRRLYSWWWHWKGPSRS